MSKIAVSCAASSIVARVAPIASQAGPASAHAAVAVETMKHFVPDIV